MTEPGESISEAITDQVTEPNTGGEADRCLPARRHYCEAAAWACGSDADDDRGQFIWCSPTSKDEFVFPCEKRSREPWTTPLYNRTNCYLVSLLGSTFSHFDDRVRNS